MAAEVEGVRGMAGRGQVHRYLLPAPRGRGDPVQQKERPTLRASGGLADEHIQFDAARPANPNRPMLDRLRVRCRGKTRLGWFGWFGRLEQFG